MEKNNSPFLNLLKEENLKKIKIDKELIPIFKIVICKINDYFEKNNLMDCKDWNAIFERFLLTESEEQATINIKPTPEYNAGGEYDTENRKIYVFNTTRASSLCHEFIHFLVMCDANPYTSGISKSSFFNEGMTEYLTSCIFETGNSSSYFKEYATAKFYCEITQNAIANFLNDKFAFKEQYYTPPNLINASYKFYNENTLDSYLYIQREIIYRGIDDFTISSFDDFINIVTIINKRVEYDAEMIDYIFERIVDKFIISMNYNEQQTSMIKDKLINFCKILNKYQLYGDNEVAEFVIDGLHIAFDKKGNVYNDFPLDGENKRGSTFSDPSRNLVVVTHRDKDYKIYTDKMKCKNWKILYDISYSIIKRDIDNLNVQLNDSVESLKDIKNY